MKTLLLLRHAKSSWDEPELGDHERTLNARGRRAAPRIGQLLTDESLVPEQVLCSTATRARETASLVLEAIGGDIPIEHFEELYLASPEQLFATVSQHADDAHDRVLLVAHNPGLEDVVHAVSGRLEPFPTGALARLELDVASWSSVGPGMAAKATGLWRPRELDA